MKKIITILFLACSILSYSQKVKAKITGINILGLKVDFSSKYTKAEVTHLDGTKEVGYIYGFIQNKAVTFNMQNPFSGGSYEDALNYTDKRFNFKKDLDKKPVEYTNKDIKEVKILNDSIYGTHYKLMDLYSMDSDGKLKDRRKKVWLPLYKEDVINIFSYDVYEEIEKTGYLEKAITMIYFNDPKNSYAISAPQPDLMDAFSKKKLLTKFTVFLKEIFKDCPEFINKNLDAKGLWNFESAYFNTEELEKTEKEIKKDKRLKAQDRNILLNNLDTEMQLYPYVEMIEAYKSSCK